MLFNLKENILPDRLILAFNNEKWFLNNGLAFDFFSFNEYPAPTLCAGAFYESTLLMILLLKKKEHI